MLLDDLERPQKVILFVYGAIDQLKNEGVVIYETKDDREKYFFTSKGISLYDQLTASNFKATPEEIVWCLRTDRLVVPEHILPMALSLLGIQEKGFYVFIDKFNEYTRLSEENKDDPFRGDVDYY